MFITIFFTAFLVLKELSIYLVLAHSPVCIGGNGIDDDDDVTSHIISHSKYKNKLITSYLHQL